MEYDLPPACGPVAAEVEYTTMHQRKRSDRVSLVAIVVVALVATPAAIDTIPIPHRGQSSAVASPSCSVSWTGREAEIEEFLHQGTITRLENVPIGVTKPRRAIFESGGPVARAAWKALPPSYKSGFRESYKAEIAAYLLDRLLDMKMVPPAVERRHQNQTAAIILWAENTRMWDDKNPPKGPEPRWSREISRMKMFDQLIANIDRNAGNILYDPDWHIILIDHSRAFIEKKDLRGMQPLIRVDKALWERMDALTADRLTQALGEWVSAKEIDALLARRDRMRDAIAKLVAQRGESAVYIQ